MIARLDYRTVATHYGCAYKNDGYRVMEEMADRVPGVTYKKSRTLSVDDALGVGGRHIELSFADPDLAGWMRAHDTTARDPHRIAGDPRWYRSDDYYEVRPFLRLFCEREGVDGVDPLITTL